MPILHTITRIRFHIYALNPRITFQGRFVRLSKRHHCLVFIKLCELHIQLLTMSLTFPNVNRFDAFKTFSLALSWIKMYTFRLRCHWILILRFELTIFQHWFKYGLAPTSHYHNQWWLVYWRICASLGLNELIPNIREKKTWQCNTKSIHPSRESHYLFQYFAVHFIHCRKNIMVFCVSYL